MKKILPLLLLLTLIITACGSNDSGNNKQKSNDALESDGTLNFKKMLETEGNVAYLLDNEYGYNSDGYEISKDSQVDSIIVTERDGITVYNTGINNSNGISLGKFSPNYSFEELKKTGEKTDKTLFEANLDYYNKLYENKTNNLNKDKKNIERYGKLTFKKPNFSYKKPQTKQLKYKAKQDTDGNFIITANVVPRSFKDETSVVSPHKPKYKFNESEEVYRFSELLPIMKVGNKKYIGISTVSDSENYPAMLIVEAPKGTKKVTSGLTGKGSK